MLCSKIYREINKKEDITTMRNNKDRNLASENTKEIVSLKVQQKLYLVSSKYIAFPLPHSLNSRAMADL